MTHKKHAVRCGILSTLIILLLSVALAAGVFIANARTVFADEDPSTETTEPRVNSWVENKEPDISGWAYLQYEDSFTAGKATYGKPAYSVYYNNAERSIVNETLVNFAPAEDGKLAEKVEIALNDLEVADYVFVAEVPAGTGKEEVENTDGETEEVTFEYGDCKKDVPFSVTQATNSWEDDTLTISKISNTIQTANVWSYGSYSNGTRKLVGAKAQYGETVFTVVSEDGVKVVDAFVLDKDGNIPETAVVAINTLNVGKYSFRAEVQATENYTGLGYNLGRKHIDVAFEIEKSGNDWIEKPSVLGWSYGEFESKYIQVRPACGNASLTIYELEEVETEDGTSYREVGTVMMINLENGEIPRGSVNELNLLDSGIYSLVAKVVGGNNYTGLNEDAEALDGVKFEVSKSANSWSSAPNLIWWTWGSFDEKVNVFTAVPAYPVVVAEKQVSFGIYYDLDLKEPVTGLENFTTVSGTAYNEQVKSEYVSLLKALPAGTYYLNARTQSGISESYSSLNSVIKFNVAAARNYWTSTPQIVQWTWSTYNPEVNVISATPAIGEPEDVVYGIYKDKNCNEPLADLVNFSFVKTVGQTVKYDLPEKVVAALSELGAGSYYIKAEVAGTDNYPVLSSVNSFSVQKMNNSWQITPSAHSWKFGSYDTQTNAINAQPAFGGAAVIKIYHEDGVAVLYSNNDEVVSEFKLVDGKVPGYVSEILSALGKGKYYVLASVAATDNYTGLNEYTDIADIAAHGIALEITANANAWVTVPRVLGWTEGGFEADRNKIIAEAACGNDEMRVTVLDAGGNTVISCAYGEIDYDKLAKLDVGSYRVKISVEGTNNYEGLSGETTFAVTEDAVGLTGIIAAVVVFGLFDIAAAAFCIYLVVSRRRKIEESFRNMIRKELHRR